jgi:hypothetical protein
MNDTTEQDMPVISKFYGITIRMMRARCFGARFHAIGGNSELVVKLWPLDIICGDAPRRAKPWALEWATQQQRELFCAGPVGLGGGPL